MSKLEERIARVVLGSPIYNPKKISHNDISELINSLTGLFKQWALELLPEKVDIHWGNGYGAGKNETIDEIRKRIEEEV